MQSVSCPTCGKRFHAKPELIGKRVRCPGCQEPFVVEPEAPVVPVMDMVSTPPPISLPSLARPGRAGARSGATVVTRSGSGFVLSDKQMLWLRLGGALIVFGVLALILPLFGLQFRSLTRGNADPTSVAIGVMVLGVVICVLAVGWRYGKWVVWALLGVVVLAVVGVIAAIVFRSGPKPKAYVPPGGAPMAGQVPGGMTPPMRTGPPTFEDMAGRYGADKTFHVNIATTGYSDASDKEFGRRVRKAMNDAGAKNTAWSVKGNTLVGMCGPIANVNDLVTQLSTLGAQASYDSGTQTVTLDLKSAPKTPGAP